MRGALVSMLLAIFAASAMAERDHEQKIRDAIAFFDQGEFDSAIVLLEEVLDEDPNNGFAAYELAYTYKAKGELKPCIKVGKKALRRLKRDEEQAYMVPQISMMLATCYSDSGDSRKALRTFRDGLELAPDDYLLNFNIAITLMRQGDLVEAEQHLQKASSSEPLHPSPFYNLAVMYREQGASARAMLAAFAFLQREFNTERSAGAAGATIDLLYSRLSRDEQSTAINIGLPLSDGDLGSDTTSLTIELTTAALLSAPDGEIIEPAVDSIAKALQTFLSFAANTELEAAPDSFFASVLIGDAKHLDEQGVTEPFVYFVLSQAGVEGADEWLAENRHDTDVLVEYLQLFHSGGAGNTAPSDDQETE